MPKLRIYAEGKPPVEIDIEDISTELNEIMRDATHSTSPGYRASVERPSDEHSGQLNAGSEVYIPKRYEQPFKESMRGEEKDFVAYTFLVVLDKDYSGHGKGEHWNIRIYKTYHYGKGFNKLPPFTLPKIDGIDHIKDASWIRLELINDDGSVISSKRFEKG